MNDAEANAIATVLLSQAQAGEAEARAKLIEQYTPLVTVLADRYVRRNYDRQHFHEDLVRQGELALIRAIDRAIAKHMTITNFAGYFSRDIGRQLGHAGDNQAAVGPRSRTVKKRRAENNPPAEDSLTCVECNCQATNRYYLDPFTGQKTNRYWCRDCYEKAAARGTRELFREMSDEALLAELESPESNDCDARDFLAGCCETPLEEQLVALLADGNTCEEAAEELSISVRTVYRTRRRLQERYEENTLALGA